MSLSPVLHVACVDFLMETGAGSTCCVCVMEEIVQRSCPGSRHLNLKKSFKLGVRLLLTACPKEEFCDAFQNFTSTEQEHLYQLFIHIITRLHKNIEDAFEALCLETRVGVTLDAIEELVEEQNLDPLLSEKKNVRNIENDLSAVTKNEIQLLKVLLDKAEAHKRHTETRTELLTKKMEEISGMTVAVGKMRHVTDNEIMQRTKCQPRIRQ